MNSFEFKKTNNSNQEKLEKIEIGSLVDKLSSSVRKQFYGPTGEPLNINIEKGEHNEVVDSLIENSKKGLFYLKSIMRTKKLKVR